MDRMKRYMIIITLLFATMFVAKCDSSPSIESFQKSLDYDTKKFKFYTGISDKTNDFFYALCNKTYLNRRVDYKCKVTIETPLVSPLDSSKKTCDVWVSNWQDDDRDIWIKSPQYLDEKNVFFTRFHANGYKFVGTTIYIIRKTNCHVVELSLPNIEVIWTGTQETKDHEDVFNVIFSYRSDKKTPSSNVDCLNYYCIITYNMNGRVIDGPTQYQKKSNNCYSNSGEHWEPLFSSDLINHKSMYYYKIAPQRGLCRVRKDGLTTELFTTDLGYVAKSFANSKIGYCIDHRYGSVTCKQYDFKDKVLMDFNLNLTDFLDHSNHHKIEVYNLQHSGMIVLIVEIQGYKLFGEIRDKIVNLKIIWVKNDGQLFFVEIPYGKNNFITNSNNQFMISEDVTKLCLKFISSRNFEKDSSNLQVINDHVMYGIDCLPKNLFKSLVI